MFVMINPFICFDYISTKERSQYICAKKNSTKERKNQYKRTEKSVQAKMPQTQLNQHFQPFLPQIYSYLVVTLAFSGF